MADGLNSMLEQGHLSPSLCQGTVRLIPKVKEEESFSLESGFLPCL
jgi:hypothetical protein